MANYMYYAIIFVRIHVHWPNKKNVKDNHILCITDKQKSTKIGEIVAIMMNGSFGGWSLLHHYHQLRMREGFWWWTLQKANNNCIILMLLCEFTKMACIGDFGQWTPFIMWMDWQVGKLSFPPLITLGMF